MSKLENDPRVDPRIKALMGAMPPEPQLDVDSRQQVLDAANSTAALSRYEQMVAMFEMLDNEDIAPSAGLEISSHDIVSSPDGNTVKLQLIKPVSKEATALCLLHSRRRHAGHVLLYGDVPGLG
jgi:acetyl esterase